MTRFRFGSFEADEPTFELRREGRAVRVQRIVLETIFFLLRTGGRVVTRRDLAQGPWKGMSVSDGAVSRAVMQARRAISDDSGSVIVTVHGRGYHFVAEVKRQEQLPPDRVGGAVTFDAVVANVPDQAEAAWVEGGASAALRSRAVELEVLRSAFTRARGGQGQVVIVSGDAGMGKTTLVEDWAHQLETQGTVIAFGRSWEASSAPPLWPWFEIVRSCLSEYAIESKALITLLTDFGRGAPPRKGGLCGNSEAIWVFDAVSDFLRDVSSVRPLAIVLEDVHHADEASVLLLEFLRRRIREMPLLLVATRRPLENDRRGRFPLDESGPHLLAVRLSGLSATEVRTLAHALGRPCTEATAVRIHDVTGGNPLLIRKLLASSAGSTFETNEEPGNARIVVRDRIARLLRRRILALPLS